MIAVDVRTGVEKWVRQINPGDVWNYKLSAWDPETGLYKDQSIGDTPKPYWLFIDGRWRRVVGVGCKNGGFYVIAAVTGETLYCSVEILLYVTAAKSMMSWVSTRR